MMEFSLRIIGLELAFVPFLLSPDLISRLEVSTLVNEFVDDPTWSRFNDLNNATHHTPTLLQPYLPQLVGVLGDERVDERVICEVLDCLYDLVPDDASIAAVEEFMLHEDFFVRTHAAVVVAHWHPENASAVQLLHVELQSEEPSHRWTAAWACGVAGDASDETLRLLLAGCEDETGAVRVWSAMSLYRLGHPVEECQAVLVEALTMGFSQSCVHPPTSRWDFSNSHNATAAHCLRMIGEECPAAEPILKEMLADDYPDTSPAAYLALKVIVESEEALLREVIDDERYSRHFRWVAQGDLDRLLDERDDD